MSQNSMFIYSWCIDEKETEFTKIRIYGIDKENKNICLHVHDFTPYVYLELPTYTEWNERKAQLLGNKIDEELGEFAPLRKSLIMKHKLYGAHFDKNGKRKKFPYLFCSFAHKSHIDKKLSSLVRKSLNVQGIGHVRMKVHESSADPVLQLVCCRDIPSIGWIKFVGEELIDDSKYTLCDKEYNVKWKGIFNADENTVGLPLIMGFDIEVNSTNPTVMPKAKNPGDKVFQISCIFNREGQNECESYLLTLAEAEQKTVGENIKIISCKTEADLLTSFTELVRIKKPNIITGYNILGFDIQYMIDRAKVNLCISKFDQIGFHLYNHSKEKTIKWSSSAYKNQEFSYLDAEGIIFVDLLPLIRRDFKFSSYNLKTVSKEILKDDTKVDLSIPRMFKLYKIGTQKLKDGTYSKKSKKAMGIIGKYCFKDSELCVKLMQKMQTWVGLTEMAKTCIAAGEYVTINNRSVPIETLKEYKNILSWNNENQGLMFNKQINFLDQGTKECVKIYFENGTTLTCTNDHKILNEEGNWVEVSKIKIGERIKHGLQFPKQNIFDDIKICNNYTFYIGDLIYNTNNYEEYEKSLAFCRILGWLLTDGSNNSNTERGRLFIGHKLDVEIVLQDIYLLTKKNVKPYEEDQNFVIELPKILIKNINKCGVVRGKKSENSEKFLDFIMNTNFPLPLLREFLGGLFGGDGHTITWNSIKNRDFETVKFTRTKIPKLEQNLKEWFQDLQILLLRFNIKTTITKYIKNKNISMILTILKEDCIKFYDSISFRYCVHKIQKLFIGCSYFKYKNEILRQRNWVINQTKKYIEEDLCREDARIKACDDLLNLEPIINTYSIPTKNQMKWFLNPSRVITSNIVKFSNNPIHILTPYEYLKNINALQFFDDENNNISYGVSKDSNAIPTINLKIIDIRKAGLKKVYDITVENNHSFLANGVVCHNCNTGIFSLYTQGQQIKVYSQVYRYCLKHNFVVEKDGYVTKEGERYAGAHVFPPVPGLYERVLPFDFASLYPTTMIAYNLDYSTLVPDDSNIPNNKCNIFKWADHINCKDDPKVIKVNKLTDYIDREKKFIKELRNERDKKCNKLSRQEFVDEIKKKELELKPYIEERSQIKKTISKNILCGERVYKFYKEEKGVIPTILQNLLDARKNTRKQIKNSKCKGDDCKGIAQYGIDIPLHCIKHKKEDEKELLTNEKVNDIILLNNVLEKRQLAYKVSANSMYGAYGVQKGYLPFMPGAMCTTYMGRTNIEIVAKTIQEKYGGKLVYGDTDSNYINFPSLKTAHESWDYAEKVAKEVSALFPPPISLAFEEAIYWQFLILTKKRYMYRACGRDGVVDKKIGKKGVLLARRDNSVFIRTLYEQVIAKVFDNVNRDDILYFILEELNRLFSNSLDYKSFVITKAVGDTAGFTEKTKESQYVIPFTDEKGKVKGKIGNYTVPLLSDDPDEREDQMRKKGALTTKEYYEKCLPAQVQLAEKIRRRGGRVESGARIEYLIINSDNGHKGKQYEKIEDFAYFKSHSNILKVDFFYYLDNLINPLDEVLDVVFGKDEDQTKYKYKFKKGFIESQYNFRYKIREKVMEELREIFSPKLIFKE